MKLVIFSLAVLFFASCASPNDDKDNNTVPANAPIQSTGATSVTNPATTDSSDMIMNDTNNAMHTK